MAGYRRFDDVTIGETFPETPLQFEVSADRVAAFLDATGNDAAVPGDGTAPSMLAALYLVDLLKARGSPPGGIHAKQALRFHRNLRIGETLTVQGHVVETYRRRGRPYVVSEFEARGGDGGLVSSGRITSIWGADA